MAALKIGSGVGIDKFERLAYAFLTFKTDFRRRY